MNRRMRETDKQPRHVRSSKHGAISNGNPRLPPNSGPSTVPSGYFCIFLDFGALNRQLPSATMEFSQNSC